MKYNSIILLGPTAVGKTSLGVSLASHFGFEIISADSRQVYKGLDLGSGKDIEEYTLPDGTQIPFHLIDITTLASEYNVFHFQKDFYNLYSALTSEKKVPFVVGGTGMYVDSIARGYDFIPVPENTDLRSEFEKKPLEELSSMLIKLKPDLHNKSDLLLRDRVVRALEIELYKSTPEGTEAKKAIDSRPKVNPLVIGTTIDRDILHKNIEIRLKERLEQGMIEEVENLHKEYSWERLEKLGLEYRFVSLYLEKKIETYDEMFFQLYHAICQFAKRQETWFRGMEKKGVKINWLPKENSKLVKMEAAVKLIEESGVLD